MLKMSRKFTDIKECKECIERLSDHVNHLEVILMMVFKPKLPQKITVPIALLIVAVLCYRLIRVNHRIDTTTLALTVLTMIALVLSLLYNVAYYVCCRRLEEMALRDQLTGLLNRRGFLLNAGNMLNDANNHGEELTFISVDLDGLKEINDIYGHLQGDRALVEAGRILSSVFRQGVVGRMGGDEFAILIMGDGCDRLSEMEKRLKELNETPGRLFKLGMSVGYATTMSGEKLSISELMALADRSMYAQKRDHCRQVRSLARF